MKQVPINRARSLANEFNTDQLIILQIDRQNGKVSVGYTSYGKTKELCDNAKKLADASYETVIDELSFIG